MAKPKRAPKHKPLTDQQRLFAQAKAKGMSGEKAVAHASYKSRGKAARVQAARLLANDSVTAYLEELRAESDKAARVDRERAIEILSEAVITPIGEIGPNHPLAQEYRVGKHGETIKMPGKIEALRELAKILGWYEPEKHDHTVRGFEVIERIRKKRDV